MEDNSKDSRRIENTPSDHQVDSTTAEIGEECTESRGNSTSSENVQQQVASADEPSTSEDGDTLHYRGTEFENEEDSDDCADVERKYKAPKNLLCRTYSDSHLPVDEIPQLQIYDLEAKNKGEKNISRYEKNLKSFKEASSTWSTIRDQSEATVEQRLINSDGEIAKMSFYSEMNEINSDLSLSLRSVSAPPEISAETRQGRKYCVSELRNDLFKSGGTSLSESDESYRTKSELSETKCTTESANKKSLRISAEDAGSDQCSRLFEGITENINPADVEVSSIKQAFSSGSETETSSETSYLMDLEEKCNFFLENISGIEISCSLTESEKPGISRVIYLNPPSGRISDLNTSPDISVITGTKTKSPLQHDLGPEEAGSSASSEISRILEDSKTLSPTFIEYYSSTDNETSSSSEYSFANIADIGKDKSPPKITAEPPSGNSGIFKVPSKIKDCSTSSDLSLSQKPKSSSAPSSTRKRPTDFNVNTRSAFYTFNANSPTGLELRPYRSLPNVNRLPRCNVLRSGMDFSNLRGGVVRSLFRGNSNSNQHGSSFGSELVNKKQCSAAVKEALVDLLESRTKSKAAKKSSKHSANNASCSKACPNITVTSSKEINKNVTLQERLSSELIGDFSELNLQDFLAPQEAASSTKAVSPKRKAAISPSSTPCSPSKMPRASSSAKTVSPKRKAATSPNSTACSPAKMPRASSVKTVSPKRKAAIIPKSTECSPAKIPRASSAKTLAPKKKATINPKSAECSPAKIPRASSASSPKKKATTSANSTECSPDKIPRASSECDPNESSVKEKQDESLNTQNLLKPESASVKTNISPKRKSEDVNSCAAGTSTSDTATEDGSRVKKTKVNKKSPVGEIYATHQVANLRFLKKSD